VQLKWMAETTSSVYATPIITDLYADGFKDIIVPSFVHNLEVFQGDNGAQAAGFPAFHSDKVHASPIMFDIDRDGIQDILVATYSGEILFYQDNGQQLPLQFTIPRLSVKRCARYAYGMRFV
jgi:FG-GAP-like repeat